MFTEKSLGQYLVKPELAFLLICWPLVVILRIYLYPKRIQMNGLLVCFDESYWPTMDSQIVQHNASKFQDSNTKLWADAANMAEVFVDVLNSQNI